jgi:hypothetical protein
MREFLCADDCIELCDDDNDSDMVIVEPYLIHFSPVGDSISCNFCGQPMRPWSWRHVAVNHYELECTQCCRVVGSFRLGAQIRR